MERARHAKQSLGTIGVVEVHETAHRGDETRIAREGALRGARAIVVVGGDGSVSNAARGIVEAGSSVPLAIVAAGTGNDFAKSLGTPVHDIAATTALLARGETRAVDVGVVDGVTFVNAAGFGFDVHVLEQMERALQQPGSGGLLRGTAAYVGTALRALAGYPGFQARHALVTSTKAQLMLVFANGRYFGGAFHIAPMASLSSGALDVVVIDAASPLRRLALFARAIRGAHLAQAEVRHTTVSSYRLSFDAPPRFEADGELHQARSADIEITVRPGALRVIV